ncbi:MAG TPA: YihY/virulence factor BrkB family protein [Methylomirabilota bacterium]|nr:YihY/virulence factor BrkB family protein [Methylomirabilota bacterium]
MSPERRADQGHTAGRIPERPRGIGLAGLGREGLVAIVDRLTNVARAVWREVREDELLDRAAALSYYLLFALFPLLLFLTALLGLLPWHLMDLLMGYLDMFVPSDVVRRTFSDIAAGATHGLLSAGIAVAFWSASSGILAVMAAVNAAYDIDEQRPWWRQRLVALALTLGVSLFTVVALALLMFGPELGGAVADWLGLGSLFAITWELLRWPVVVGLVVIGVGIVYHFAPAVRLRWRWLTPGSTFAVVCWLVMSLGLRLYVTHFAQYNLTYGSIAGVIVLLLWLYLIGVALLIGAEIDAELSPPPRSRSVALPRGPAGAARRGRAAA